MNIISFEKWEPTPENPHYSKYIGQRTAQEVFDELHYQLENTGYLPDEYFLLDRDWRNGREIPKDADIFCTTDYGENEGVYIDVYLKWHDENKNSYTKSFITGKTLGESGKDLDRMFLISSAITKAFHGDNASHTRYIGFGETVPQPDIVMHLNDSEQKIMTDALIGWRNQMKENLTEVDRLLRKMTGSITEYVNAIGDYPLKISDYDKAELAVRDGNLEAFRDCLSNVPADKIDELLILTAARPGTVGRQMTSEMFVLAEKKKISNENYLLACKKAVDVSDLKRVQILFDAAEGCVQNLDKSLYGETILHAVKSNPCMITELVNKATTEQISAAPPFLLYAVAQRGIFHLTKEFINKGINGNEYAADIISMLYQNKKEWMTVLLLRNGMKVDSQNLSALHACIKTKNTEAAKILLEQGMDFDQYKEWAQSIEQEQNNETLDALNEYWISRTENQEQEYEQNEGMTMS